MKVFIALSAVTLSLNSFAISSQKLISACEKVGTEKVVAQAKASGLQVDAKSVKECGVDNRPFTVASYVWFCAETSGGEKEIRVLTQKPAFKPCF